MFGYSREAVRVKVKKCEGKLQTELRKFSVDPQITSLEVLQSILVKAFDIKSEFTLWYRTLDDYGQEIYLPLLSDWDLDAAFLKAHNIAVSTRSEPCVQLKVDMKPFSEAVEDWEPCTSPAIQSLTHSHADQQSVTIAQPAEKIETSFGFQGIFMNQVEKTFNMVSRALNLYEDPNAPQKPSLCDAEFRTYLDSVGKITNGAKLKEAIYCGGIEPSLRKVVWKHILNVYPDGMNGKQRMDYIKRKANEYYTLKAKWKESIQKGKVNADLAYVTSMVRKDVLRTDRHHVFYAGSDDNQNIASLFNILTTYALNHPSVSYCQGMSDLASPLLVTMGDEAHAYICLCALMRRLRPNFLLDGEAMTLKFAHLTESLQVYDPEFYNYLKSQQADDLLFCYRWLLLEMKREFAFDDALRMLEVLWASLPYKVHSGELCLVEKEFDPTAGLDNEPTPISPRQTHRENAYTKLCAIRRQSSSFSLATAKNTNLSTYKQMNYSLDESEHRRITNNASLKHVKEFQSLDDTAIPQGRDEKVTKDTQDKQHIRNTMNTLHEQHETAAQRNRPHLTNGSSEVKNTPLGKQIRLLRDKISVHNNRHLSASLDKLDTPLEPDAARPKVKMIRNLNEFLNFATATKSSEIKQDKLQRAHSVIERSAPNIQSVANTSFDDGKSTKKDKPLPKISKNVEKYENSSPDDSQDYYPMTTSMTRELRLELEHLDRQVFGPTYVINQCKLANSSPTSISVDDKYIEDTKHTDSDQIYVNESSTEQGNTKNTIKIINQPTSTKNADDIYLWENPLHKNVENKSVEKSGTRTPDEQAELDFDTDTGEIIEDDSGKKSITPIRLIRAEPSTECPSTTSNLKHSIEHSSDSESSERELTQMTKSPNEIKNSFFSSMSQELENAKRNCETILNTKQTNLNSVASTLNNIQKKYEAFKPPAQRAGGGEPAKTISSLPPPSVFGGGNPFLMYLCLTVLLQHRDYIMRNHMDYNELAMHFDKMVRKHNVNRVLNQARQMYAMYLKHQTQIKLRKNCDITT